MMRLAIACVWVLTSPAWAQADQSDQIHDLLGRVTLPQAASVRGALAEDRIFHTDPGDRRYETRVRYAPDWVEMTTIDHDPELGDIPQTHLVDDGTENRSLEPVSDTGSRGPSRVASDQVGLEQMVSPEGWIRWATSHAAQLELATTPGRAIITGLGKQITLSTDPVRVLSARILDSHGLPKGTWVYEDYQPVGSHDEHPRRVHNTLTDKGQLVVDRIYDIFSVEPIDPTSPPEQVTFRDSTAVDDLFEGRRVRWGTGETIPSPTAQQIEQFRNDMRHGNPPKGPTTPTTSPRTGRWPVVAIGVGLILAGLILWHIRRG